MVFSSLEFLFLFLPIGLFAVYIAPRRFRNAAILFVSLVFYAWGGLFHLPLMLLCIAVNFALGILIFSASGKKKKRALLAAAVAFNIFLLFFFKYANSAAALLGISARIALPIGISFYTFQSLSYVLDVYKGDAEPERNIVNFAAYVALFPQLIAGPIVKYRDVAESLSDPRRPSACLAASGIRTFVCGLSKKVIMAGATGEIWNAVSSLAESDRTALLSWFGLFMYALHVYFDFSGYSDMAIGLGKLLSFKFPENFYYPYTAVSVTDFWRRWHITLSSWFFEYLYIPLGGSRSGSAKTFRNLFFVWLFTGLWHGATLNFALWGLYYFLILAAEKAFLLRLLDRAPKFISRAYTLLLVLFGWLIFAFDDSFEGLSYLRGMFFASGAFSATDIYDILRNLLLIAVCVFACTGLPRRAFYSLYEKSAHAGALSLFLCAAAFFFCVVFLVNSSYNPFLYFRF